MYRRLFKVREADKGSGAGGAPDWRAALPEDVRGAEALKDVKDVAGLAKAFIDTKAFVGQSLRVPGPDAGPEDRKKFYEKLHEKVPQVLYMPETDEEKAALEPELWKRLGRPADAKGYDLEGVDLGGVQLNIDDLRSTANTLGMTKKQFQEFAKGVAGVQSKAAAELKADQDRLKQEWGAAYEEKLAGIAELAQKLGASEAEAAALKAGRYASAQLKVWDAVMKAVGGEGGEVRKQGEGSARTKLTPGEAQARIAEIMGRKEYWEPSINPGLHKHLLEEMLKLQEMANP